MQVLAQYVEDRSVDMRHVAVMTLPCTKRDQTGVDVSGRWFVVTREDKEGCIVAHMFAASLGAPACD